MAAIAVRPEDIKLLPPNSDSGVSANGALRHRARILRSRFLGGHIEYTVAVDSGANLTVRADSHRLFTEGETVDLLVDPDRLVVLPR
jgi:ABC-type Fe3+/spermidine/putrescine transport system ATPase subunit